MAHAALKLEHMLGRRLERMLGRRLERMLGRRREHMLGRRRAQAPCLLSHALKSSVKYSRRIFLNSVEE